jgi:hypothetical protein
MLKDEGIEKSMVTTLHGTDITWLEIIPFTSQQCFSINKSDIVTSFQKV